MKPPAFMPPAVSAMGLGWCTSCAVAFHKGVGHKCGDGKVAVVVATKPEKRSLASKRCVLGHVHRGAGERTACPIVHAAAANRGLVTFVPGSPGIACFCLAPNESGRPVYVSIDWVLVNAAHKIVLGLDWKGETTHSAMYGHGDGFARTKRIFETETGAKVVELERNEDIESALGARE